MKVPARVKSAFRSRNVLHFFCVFSLASKHSHKKSRRAFASRSLRLVESTTVVFDLTARSLPRRRARVQRETQTQRERERERTFFAGRRVFSNSTKKYSGKARERKPIMVSKETALHDPDELLFYLRGEDDREIVAESAKGQSEPKRTSMTAKQRLKQQLHLQKQKERQRKTNEEMALGKQLNATREKSSEQSGRLVRMRRSMQNGQ